MSELAVMVCVLMFVGAFAVAWISLERYVDKQIDCVLEMCELLSKRIDALRGIIVNQEQILEVYVNGNGKEKDHE